VEIRKVIIVAALVGVLVSGPVWADEKDAILLTCSGKYVQGKSAPITKNITIARDGSWIDFGGKLERSQSKGGVWYYDDKSRKQSPLTMEVSILYETLSIIAIYKVKDMSPASFIGGCSPIINPLKF